VNLSQRRPGGLYPGPLTVIGAGVAGLAAAITACKAGREVVVYERNRDVGGRFHGDFQGLENWSDSSDVLEEFASLGIAPNFTAVPVRRQICFAPHDQEYVFQSNQPFYYLITRGPQPGTLDYALKEQALAVGADIRFGEPIREPPPGSIVAWGPRRANALAVGYLFETELSDGDFAVIDDQLSPGGYGYLLIHGGQATLATCLFHDFRNHQTYLERTVDFFCRKLQFSVRSARLFGGVGNVHWSPPPNSERVFRAGEAAGLQDALWGFGLRYAVLSGRYAAVCVAHHDEPHRVYNSWQKTIGQRVCASVVNRYLFERLGKAAYYLLFERLSQSTHPHGILQRLYASTTWKRALFALIHQCPSRLEKNKTSNVPRLLRTVNTGRRASKSR
jgi:flavin-dependent dehydrogenase